MCLGCGRGGWVLDKQLVWSKRNRLADGKGTLDHYLRAPISALHWRNLERRRLDWLWAVGSANERYSRYELAEVVERSTDKTRGLVKRQRKPPLVAARRSCASPAAGGVERLAMRRCVGRTCAESQLVK